MCTYKKIVTTDLAVIETIQRPADGSGHLDMDSRALDMFTDFEQRQPLMLEASVGIADAEYLMKKAHVHLMLVISKEESFRGVVSLADLVSVKVTKAMAATGLKRGELTVGDVMTQKSDMHAIEFKEFSHAKIRDLVSTMEDLGENHLLIVDSANKSVRGIVSASDIARRLHVSVHISERAKTFSDIYNAVHP
ncbi:MAG: CBS domain-containing protein [Halioglobus sp.]|jgi:CBS domain-containing protein